MAQDALRETLRTEHELRETFHKQQHFEHRSPRAHRASRETLRTEHEVVWVMIQDALRETLRKEHELRETLLTKHFVWNREEIVCSESLRK